MKKTIGKAPCPLCGSGPHPVKVSETGYLYMNCPPPADGGCQNQFFCRHAHSNQLLAQSITEWSIPKEERKKWLGDTTAQPDQDEVAEELAEEIAEGNIEVEATHVPPPPPPPPRQRQRANSPPPSPPSPPTRQRSARSKQKKQDRPKSFLGGLITLE